MSRLEELTSRFEAADAADAAAGGNASTQNPTGEAADAVAGTPENAGDAGTQNTAGEGAGEQAAAAAPAPASPAPAAAAAAPADDAPAWFSKALQREQIERANVTKEIQALQKAIEARGGAATAAENRQLQNAAANLEQSNQRFTKIKATLGKDFDAFEKSGEVFGDLTSVVEEQATLLAEQAKELKELKGRLDAGDVRSQQQVQADQFWEKFETDNPGVAGRDLWNDSLREAADRGLAGEAQRGAADVLWQFKVDAAKAAKPAPLPSTGSPAQGAKAPTAPARTAPVTPGAARVVQPGAGARTPAAAKSAEQQIEAGDVDFGFTGRYDRFKS